MKNAFATIIGTSVLTAGIVSMSALSASAASLVGTYSGNDNADPVTYNGVEYNFFGKYDVSGTQVSSGKFTGNQFAINFTSISGNEVKAGTASAGTGAGLFSIKAGNGYALYYTDDLSSISWDTSNRQNKGLSHLSIWQGPGGGPQKEVPEPLTLLGSGLALGFGGMFQKKRNAKKSAK